MIVWEREGDSVWERDRDLVIVWERDRERERESEGDGEEREKLAGSLAALICHSNEHAAMHDHQAIIFGYHANRGHHGISLKAETSPQLRVWSKAEVGKTKGVQRLTISLTLTQDIYFTHSPKLFLLLLLYGQDGQVEVGLKSVGMTRSLGTQVGIEPWSIRGVLPVW